MADVDESAQNGAGDKVKDVSPVKSSVKSPVKKIITDKADVESEKPSTEENTDGGSTAEDEKDTDSAHEKKNEKADDEPEKEIIMTPELERKVIRQIEFYFGDLNLARDKFMQGEIKENDGWISMETMLKFNRLKNLCNDVAKIVQSAKKSTSGLLEFSEDESKVRRSVSKPVPSNTEERRADLKARTCYVRRFPEECKMGDLLDFFDRHSSTELIQMRRTSKKVFKGSVFVIFPTKEEADRFLKLKDLKYTEDGEALETMYKDAYFQSKIEQKKAHVAGKPESKKDGDDAVMDDAEKEKAKKEEDDILRSKITKGAILHLVGMTGDTVRDEIKAAFEGDDIKIAWIDFDKGDSDAWVRFDAEDGAKTAWEKHSKDNKVIIKDSDIRGDVLEDDVELHHWKNIFQARAEKNSRGGRGGRGGRGRGRGGRWGGKGRKGGGGDDGPAFKRSRRN